MSKVKIVGNASGSGTLTLTGPDTNSDRTVTFPDATGTMMFTDSDVANLTGTLPAISGANLTALNGTQVTSGTVPAARLPTGSVIQVVQGSFSTEVDTTANTFIALGLDADITPSATSSKILIIYDVHYDVKADNAGCGTRLRRDSTDLTTGATSEIYSATAGVFRGRSTYHYLDSPSSTSAINYNIQVRANGLVEVRFCNANHPVRITLMEIAG
jgi:hypothetical protein